MRRDQFVKKMSTAIARAKGNPILEIRIPNEIPGRRNHVFYLPIEDLDAEASKNVEISLYRGDGKLAGLITARHLNRLCNANHAQKTDDRLFGYPDAWPEPAEEDERSPFDREPPRLIRRVNGL